MSSGNWSVLRGDEPELFARLRELGPCEGWVRCSGGRVRPGPGVEVPGFEFAARGPLRVEMRVDRFAVIPFDAAAGSRIWFARRRGRGRPPYWQVALEVHAEGTPRVVLYLTAEPSELEIRFRAVPVT